MQNFEVENPLIVKESTSTNKKILITILSIIGLGLCVAAIIVIILISQENYEKEDNKGEPEEEHEEEEIEIFEYGLNIEQLEDRTNSEHLGHFTLLKKDSIEYTNLADGDKQALKHLIKAASILEDIELRIDNIHNIPFRKFIEKEIKNVTNKHQANLTKILFYSEKGICGRDSQGEEINLVNNTVMPLGLGLYPENLTEDEYYEILENMLNENKIEEVRNITNQRTVVEWDENNQYLKSTDYVIYFKDQFNKIAEELIKASEKSTNADFNEYLKLQADALKTADPALDAKADKKWATLQNTPLEFTITRENYDEIMTTTTQYNETLDKLLNDKGIYPIGKDSLGMRVGIVNQEGTNLILKIVQDVLKLAYKIPHKDEFTPQTQDETNKILSRVDVDLVILAGDIGAYRGMMYLEQTLPNDDKLSVQEGGGKRTIYQRQLRKVNEGSEKLTKKLEDMLDKDQIKYYDPEAIHWFTICSGVAEILGPNTTNSALRRYEEIIEYCKRDLIAFAYVDDLEIEFNTFNSSQTDKIKVSNIVDFFLKEKPRFNDNYQKQKIAKVIENYLFFTNGVYNLTTDNKIHINIDKVSEVAENILDKVIKIQINNNYTEAYTFCYGNFKWTNEMQIISEKLKNYDNELHFVTHNELADFLLSDTNE